MKLPHPFLFIAGYRAYTTESQNARAIFSLCSKNSIPYSKSRINGEILSFCVPFFYVFKFEKAAREQNIAFLSINSYGLPALCLRYRKRYGLMLGFLISVCLIVLSGSVIWDIRIDGERRLSEDEVRAVLADCGLDIGTKRRDIDVDTLQNRIMIRSDDIAWISVNVIGTVAEVEIRELDIIPDDEELPSASNLVAERDGKIVGFENAGGNISVEIGESVSEGQLLIGGIYGDEESGFRYCNPKGRVLAETVREKEIKILRKAEKKHYTGEVKCEKYLIFFKKRIKFFTNYRNLPPICDKIIIEEFFPAPRSQELPFGVMTVRYLEYETKEVCRDDDTLRNIADAAVDAYIATELADSSILRKKIEFEIFDDCLIARCKIKCIEDIAVRKKLEIEG